MTVQNEQKLTVTEHRTRCGQRFGHLTLNKPKALNALDLAMATAMLNTLRRWQTDPDIVFVLIDSVGDKAFCAGGDIVSMYHAMIETPGKVPPFIEQFFTVEYELDHALHTYTKPVVAWGDGIVMGGGMGLLQGASHRVVTETSRLAMPEITIGLFPDVGGSYFLPRIKGKLGLFLGMTAAQLNGYESVRYGMADVLCSSVSLKELVFRWQNADWSARTDIGDLLTTTLSDYPPQSSFDDRMAGWVDEIEKACSEDSASEVKQRLLAIDPGNDKWFGRAQQTLRTGSPITAALFYWQFRKGSTLSLADCFRMELIMSCRCAEFGELQEGIRALLIDKDGTPAWKYKDISEIPEEVIARFFAPPWEGEHPLNTLGE